MLKAKVSFIFLIVLEVLKLESCVAQNCNPIGFGCSNTSDCCSGRCVVHPGGNICACESKGAPCSLDADCCNGNCENFQCGCLPHGRLSLYKGDCCSEYSKDGYCHCLNSSRTFCVSNENCCSGVCSGFGPSGNSEGFCANRVGSVCSEDIECDSKHCYNNQCCISHGSCHSSSQCCTGQCKDDKKCHCLEMHQTCSNNGECCVEGCNGKCCIRNQESMEPYRECFSNEECCSGRCFIGGNDRGICECTPYGINCTSPDGASCCSRFCENGQCGCVTPGGVCPGQEIGDSGCCFGRCSSGKCKSEINEPCYSDPDCLTGFCNDNFCCEPTGNWCSSDLSCCSKNCINNNCA